MKKFRSIDDAGIEWETEVLSEDTGEYVKTRITPFSSAHRGTKTVTVKGTDAGFIRRFPCKDGRVEFMAHWLLMTRSANTEIDAVDRLRRQFPDAEPLEVLEAASRFAKGYI
ncbi:hypothetical protein [Roseospira navarrensis]|uniref:Uncharacterized protein n=1 Tax=Roseospira navarrensis TaxID=140058 RepID=A0A7X1ZEI8_9PROT|nr:hypothetical protein [Roseospira navarrensis]MQX35957.1 hypothetical protein [Roseospira navarrensis]